MASPARYIDVVVEEHEALPDGCELRFHAVGPPRPVARVRWEPLSGPEGDFAVTALDAGGAEGPAQAAPVDDSGAGTSTLIWGGARGVRLRRVGGGAEGDGQIFAEPYLLLADEAIIG